MHIIAYIYIYIYVLSSSRKRHDVFFTVSSGFLCPVAAGSHEQTSDGTIKNVFLPRWKPFKNIMETIKKQRRKPVPKTQKTRTRLICSKMLDPPAAAESTKSPATEAMKNVTETIEQPTTETSPKSTKQTRNRSIRSRILDHPSAAESTNNSATEP